MRTTLLKVILVVLGSFFLLDLVFLNWQVFKTKESFSFKSGEVEIVLPSPTLSLETNPLSCPQDCLEIIYQATLSGEKPLPTATSRVFSPGTQVKEFYVPLGTGSTTATVWTDIPGAEAYINPANYGKIKSLTFEASLRVPSGSGRVYARLYNVNDKLGIFESEISGEGISGQRVESSKLNFSSGNKLYRVQLKTTMGVEGDLDIGRVKIIIE